MINDHDDQVEPFIHLVFVRTDTYDKYKAYWSNLVGIVELPENMSDVPENVHNGGIGFARRFIQRLAFQLNIKRFYMSDDRILYLKRGKVDENGLVERPLDMEVTSLLKIHDQLMKIGNAEELLPEKYHNVEKHPDLTESDSYASFTGNYQYFNFPPNDQFP